MNTGPASQPSCSKSILGGEVTPRLTHVDGMRGLAILAVLGFHFEIPGFSAGAIGVDVFFVISGFLICGQIIEKIRKGHFSLSEFFAHRILRIIPPIFAVLISTCAVLWFADTLPHYLAQIFKQAAASIGMLANHHFANASYFEATSYPRPFLHLWSLSVEEQFYLVAPLFLLLALKRRFLFGFLFLFAFVSIAIALAFPSHPLSFFALPPRICEFAAGAFAATLSNKLIKIPSWIGLAALAAMCGSLALPSGMMAFPSFYIAIPVLSTCLILMLASDDTAAKVISHPLIVATGLISYSLYLWHWPIEYLVRESMPANSWIARLAITTAFSFALAFLSYRLIEVPMRNLRHVRLQYPGKIVVVGTASMLTFGVLFSVAGHEQNRKWRTQPAIRALYDAQNSSLRLCRTEQDRNGYECTIGTGPVTAFLIGDSFASSLIGAVKSAADETASSVKVAWFPSCLPFFNSIHFRECQPRVFDKIVGLLASHPGAILHASWATYSRSYPREVVNDLKDTLSFLKKSGIKTLVIGPPPLPPISAPDCAYKRQNSEPQESCAFARNTAPQLLEVERRIAATAEEFGARYINLFDAFCDATTCQVIGEGGIYYYDRIHLSTAGAALVFRYFKNDFVWALEAAP